MVLERSSALRKLKTVRFIIALTTRREFMPFIVVLLIPFVSLFSSSTRCAWFDTYLSIIESAHGYGTHATPEKAKAARMQPSDIHVCNALAF
jgi:hypothetical protein